MIQEKITETVIEKLENVNLSYMITGAFACNYYGQPRLTHDLDLVVVISPADILKIVTLFKEEFYVDEEIIKEALSHKTMFNLVHYTTGFKVDFWILKEGNFSKTEFQRRKKVKLFNKEAYLATAEDTILSKLQWYKISESEKHFSDALKVYEIQKNILDINYIQSWAEKLSLGEIFNRLMKGSAL